MIRSIVFPRVLGRSLDDLQPALELFRALGFAPGNEWHEHGSHGLEMLAPSGGIEFIASPEDAPVAATIEVADVDAAYEIVKRLLPNLSLKAGDEDGAPIAKAAAASGTGPAIRLHRELSETSYGARLFEVEVGDLRVAFLTYAKKADEARGIEGRLDARGKRFAIVVSRFNSFITGRLLDAALQALRQCGAKADDIATVHVPGAFEIPAAARQLAESGKYSAIVCIGCLLRGGTLHYEVIANEVTRGIGQSAQETGVPHAFGVLTCDTLEQAIDRAGLKAGNKGFEAGLAAVEMACLRQTLAKKKRSAKRGPSTTLRSAQDDKLVVSDAAGSIRSEGAAGASTTPATAGGSAQDENGSVVTDGRQ